MDSNENISLKEFIEEKFLDHRGIDDVKFLGLETQFNIKVAALEKATIVASAAMEKRLEGMNEFRDQLRDQTVTFVTKPEYVQQINRITEDIKGLQENKSQLIGRSEHDNMLVKLNDDIRILRESKANLEGKASQSAVNVAMIISIIGIILSIVGIVNRVTVTPTVQLTPPIVQSANK
jgi:hypothetical protein